jgi:hypothetical protein
MDIQTVNKFISSTEAVFKRGYGWLLQVFLYALMLLGTNSTQFA